MPLPCAYEPRTHTPEEISYGSSSSFTSSSGSSSSPVTSTYTSSATTSSSSMTPSSSSSSSIYTEERRRDAHPPQGSLMSSGDGRVQGSRAIYETRRPNERRVTSIDSDSTATSTQSNLSQLSTRDILARHAESYSPISGPPNASMAYEPRRQFAPHITLGPVIGMVTETTARVLVEVSEQYEVKCFLTDAYGVQHGVAQMCPKNTPAVFTFAELRANTYYKVTFDIPVPGLVKAGFTTLPSHWCQSDCCARIAMVSSNDFVNQRDKVDHKTDLWRNLYNKVKAREIDYCFHLGNIAFVDDTQYKETRDGRVYAGSEPNAYQEALSYCSGLSGSALRDTEKYVCNLMRNAYRDSWSAPCVRHVLANVPNLAILGEVETGYHQTVTSEAESFVKKCAYRVYNEYCRSLFEDQTSRRSDFVKVSQAYHFHAFGALGFLFVDTQAHALFHKSKSHNDETPFLGARQWADLDYALSESGYLSGCSVLVVCTSSPVAQVSDGGWLKASDKVRRDILDGTWNCPAGVAEGSLLLAQLFDWQARASDRKVVIACGSLSDGGYSTVYDERYKKTDYVINQVTAGPMSFEASKGPAALGSTKCTKSIGAYHKFKHNKIVKQRNYAVLNIERLENAVRVTAEHVVGTAKLISSIKH